MLLITEDFNQLLCLWSAELSQRKFAQGSYQDSIYLNEVFACCNTQSIDKHQFAVLLDCDIVSYGKRLGRTRCEWSYGIAHISHWIVDFVLWF